MQTLMARSVSQITGREPVKHTNVFPSYLPQNLGFYKAVQMVMMMKLPILRCAEKLELVLSTAPDNVHSCTILKSRMHNLQLSDLNLTLIVTITMTTITQTQTLKP